MPDQQNFPRYDWNEPEQSLWSTQSQIQFQDETLRDGLQCPSVSDPPIEAKLEILHLMHKLGIHGADVGLPGAGPRAVEDVQVFTDGVRRHRARMPSMATGSLGPGVLG